MLASLIARSSELAGRLIPFDPAASSGGLEPTFTIGFGKSGKSLLVRTLKPIVADSVAVYPDEANRLWMPGLYPWHQAEHDAPPLWVDTEGIATAARRLHQLDNYLTVRRTLVLFAKAHKRRKLLLDNGKLIWFLDAVVAAFPQSKFVVVLRDGRVAAHIGATRQELKGKRHERYTRLALDLSYEELLPRFAALWAQHWQAVRVLRGRPNSLFVTYEDMCAAPDSILRRVTSFIGVENGESIHPGWRNENEEVLAQMGDGRFGALTELIGEELAEAGYA